jgi:hypothetical protein
VGAFDIGEAHLAGQVGQRRGVLAQADAGIARGHQRGGDGCLGGTGWPGGLEVGEPVGGQHLDGALGAR